MCFYPTFYPFLCFGLVLLEYFLLEKRYLLCYLLSYLTVTLRCVMICFDRYPKEKRATRLVIGISPLAEPGLDRYDASTGQG